MKKELYLIWYSYNKNFLIGKLIKDNDLIKFEYNLEGATEAAKNGCFLPFDINSDLSFKNLPIFFKRRLPLYKETYENKDPFDLLAITKGVTNQDNFVVITEKDLELEEKNAVEIIGRNK